MLCHNGHWYSEMLLRFIFLLAVPSLTQHQLTCPFPYFLSFLFPRPLGEGLLHPHPPSVFLSLSYALLLSPLSLGVLTSICLSYPLPPPPPHALSLSAAAYLGISAAADLPVCLLAPSLWLAHSPVVLCLRNTPKAANIPNLIGQIFFRSFWVCLHSLCACVTWQETQGIS